jgi:Ca2+-binding EF-hand superfamily protein
MLIFCYETPPEPKRRFLFRLYDKQGKGSIPMASIRDILTDELFVRAHYSEQNQPGSEDQKKLPSSFSERVMRDVMDDVMQKYD